MMDQGSPKVSVLILNYNGRSLLGDLFDEAIESVFNQTYPNLEVILLDNGSNDGSIDYITRKYDNRLKIIMFTENYGFCKAINLGVNYTSNDSKYLMFMNCDAVLSNDYIERLVSFMEDDRTIGAIQGLEISSTAPPLIGGLVDSLLGRPFTINIRPDSPLRVLWVAFTACVVDKRLFLSLGGLPTEFFMYHDDVDFCVRMLAHGRKSYGVPYTNYFHKRGGIVKSTVWLREYLSYRNRGLIAIRYFPKKYLLRSVIGLIFELSYTILRSFHDSDKRLETLLYLRALVYFMRNLRRELNIRLSYSKQTKDKISYFMVNVSFRLSQAHRYMYQLLPMFK